MIDRRTSPTLDDVLQVLASNEAMSPVRLRDMRSAVRRIGQMIGKPLDRLPANLSLLRSLVNELTPAAHEVSVKTFANLRSNLMAAIRHAGLTRSNITKTPAVSATQNNDSGKNTFQPSRISWS